MLSYLKKILLNNFPRLGLSAIFGETIARAQGERAPLSLPLSMPGYGHVTKRIRDSGSSSSHLLTVIH